MSDGTTWVTTIAITSQWVSFGGGRGSLGPRLWEIGLGMGLTAGGLDTGGGELGMLMERPSGVGRRLEPSSSMGGSGENDETGKLGGAWRVAKAGSVLTGTGDSEAHEAGCSVLTGTGDSGAHEAGCSVLTGADSVVSGAGAVSSSRTPRSAMT